MKNSPNSSEVLERDTRVTQTDYVHEGRKVVVRINKGGASNVDPKHRSRAKQLEDLRSHLNRLGADVDEQLHAARAGKPAPRANHNTIMCVPELTSLLFLLFMPVTIATEETVNV